MKVFRASPAMPLAWVLQSCKGYRASSHLDGVPSGEESASVAAQNPPSLVHRCSQKPFSTTAGRAGGELIEPFWELKGRAFMIFMLPGQAVACCCSAAVDVV